MDYIILRCLGAIIAHLVGNLGDIPLMLMAQSWVLLCILELGFNVRGPADLVIGKVGPIPAK